MASVLANVAAGAAGSTDAPRLLVGTGKDQTHLLVVCTADRGLCGAFNSSIARLAREHTNRLTRDGKDVKILCVGRKGYDILRRQFPRQIIDVIELRSVRQIGFVNADDIGKRVLELYADNQFDVCTLFFAEFKSVISQIPTARQLVPAEVTGETKAAGGGAIYEYEPDEESILADLLPRNLSIQIFRALLENVASEQGAKMSAMDNATRNAGDMIDRYTLLYNRTRQAQITKELIEIISGAEAL
jgi:F-type H+-transporting ATPase subunit gamma